MTLIGLDLNATRARALGGPSHSIPDPLFLEGDRRDLPMALNLEGRVPLAGRAALAVCRRSPGLVLLDFLPHLGTGRVQTTGSYRLDADAALAHVLHTLNYSFGSGCSVAVALPPYLTDEQAQRFAQLAAQARWCLLATAPAALLAAAAAQPQLPWSGLAVVLDVDGAALTWSAVAVAAEQVRLIDVWATRRLARGMWLQALVDGAARRCIRLSQRDPRASAIAEQSLHDQLARLLSRASEEDRLDVHVQTPDWSQHLDLRPSDLTRWCQPLTQQALVLLRDFVARLAPHGPATAVLATSSAARLPGLADAVQGFLNTGTPSSSLSHDSAGNGSGWLSESAGSARVFILDPDAMARAAHDLGSRVAAGDCAAGHYDTLSLNPAPSSGLSAAPIPAYTPYQAQARLIYDGMDHPLASSCYLLGRDPACDLVFPSSLFPTVSARHCEILFQETGYVLRDHSRHGTLVNDRRVVQPVALHSGDRIRLGPEGPVIQFLGQSAGQPALTR
jgi:hypothetical protein